MRNTPVLHWACRAAALAASVGQPTATAAEPGGPAVEERARSVACLTLAVAYEAGRESLAGKEAVAEVVLNRLRDPRFPKSVCDVVFAGSRRRTGCQFTFTCDGSLARPLPAAILASARAVAEQAIDGTARPVVAGATHYHADYVAPYWAPALVRLTKIGAHIFYRAPDASGLHVPGTIASVVPVAQARVDPPAPFAPWGLAPAGR